MTRDYFYHTLENEIQLQTQMLIASTETLKTAPKGYLYISETGTSISYYQILRDGEKTQQNNISGNLELVEALLNKSRAKHTAKSCKNNISILKKALNKYSPISSGSWMSEKQQTLQQNIYITKADPDYFRARFDPTQHIHETARGEMVRSKGEVIIANALWHFGIPYNYEEVFPYASDNGDRYFPDFTIHCPDGTVIIWEHWGMSDSLDYCISNAYKLNTYHKYNFSIGKNLIITQDDSNGSCSSALIYQIIESLVLPHFE